MGTKFKTLLLALLVVVLVALALAFTGKHGWLALIVVLSGMYLLLRLRRNWRGVSLRS